MPEKYADPADHPGRAVDQPVRLRRRLRHRAESVPHAGRDRAPAHRARHGRPDPRVDSHPGDTVRCIELAISNPPEAGSRPLVLNQITETHQVLELAKLVSTTMDVDIAYLPNPRREAEENDLVVLNDQFLALGLEPTTLSDGLLEDSAPTSRRATGTVLTPRRSSPARCGRLDADRGRPAA